MGGVGSDSALVRLSEVHSNVALLYEQCCVLGHEGGGGVQQSVPGVALTRKKCVFYAEKEQVTQI